MHLFKKAVFAAAALAALTGAASAQEYRRHHRHAEPQYTGEYAPLTVQPHRAAYSPYRGAGAVVTAPIAAAGTIAATPFYVANQIFPYNARDPRVIVGFPIYVAGELVQLPFRIAQAPFGGVDYRPY